MASDYNMGKKLTQVPKSYIDLFLINVVDKVMVKKHCDLIWSDTSYRVSTSLYFASIKRFLFASSNNTTTINILIMKRLLLLDFSIQLKSILTMKIYQYIGLKYFYKNIFNSL